MKTASNGVAVIATQVAKTDRRALSEAWYSALHLAHDAPRTHRDVAHAAQRATATMHTRGPLAQTLHATPRAFTIAPPAHERRSAPAAPSDERRRPACTTARRIERAVTALRAPAHGQAAQTIDVAGGRVRLLVRSSNGAVRIVAICSAPLRDPVERALAHARFALAGGGIGVRV